MSTFEKCSLLLIALLGVGCSAGTNEDSAASNSDSQMSIPSSDATIERPADCERWKAAFGTVSQNTLLALQLLTSDEGYAQQRDPNLFPALKVDPAAIGSGIDVLAGVPNPSDPGPFRQPSDAVAQLREIHTLLEANLPAGTPFGDGTGDGEKLLRLLDDFNIGGRAAISSAMEKSGCR
jgi:hypothetical protein